jgi:hypothetical protein
MLLLINTYYTICHVCLFSSVRLRSLLMLETSGNLVLSKKAHQLGRKGEVKRDLAFQRTPKLALPSYNTGESSNLFFSNTLPANNIFEFKTRERKQQKLYF